MDLKIDYKRLNKIISTTPESKPILNSQTDGFKYLHKNVFLPLLGCKDGDVALDVDVSCFTFDDLLEFDDYMCKKCENNYNNPVITLEKILDKLTPIRKPTAFV